ncbi:MAG: hydrolase [Lachnospiraceae bacterium]|nr:hydrolase [Lachnospiraceae bacterium]
MAEEIKTEKKRPVIETKLRHNIVAIPEEARAASGIVIFGRRIKTLVFTTDLAIIRNCNADAVFAVYPFTPQTAIGDAVIKYSYIPVFAGVGGGTTHGVRTIGLAKDMESSGAMGIVLNSPIKNVNLLAVSKAVDIPVVITVTSLKTDIRTRLEAGASILNVACAADTPKVVAHIRESFPDVPIIASGGNTPEHIKETVDAGANAITYTPPGTAELFASMMERYREND